MNKILSIFMLTLLISLPLQTSLSFAEEEAPEFGEDIAIQIDQIMPSVIRTGLIEQRDVKIYGLLTGILTNPTLEIPKIKNIATINYSVSTKPSGKNVKIGGISYVAPKVSGIVSGETTLSNLGAIVIPIKRIPKEADVPDEIKVDVNARINLDVSESAGFITAEDVLVEETEEEWRKDDHSFFGGYVRANEIKDDSVGFIFYDNNNVKINQNPLYIKVGEEKVIGLPFGTYGLRSFKVRVNSIRSMGSSARVGVYYDNNLELRNLREGQSLYKGSEWTVDSFKVYRESGRDVSVLILRNSKRERKEIRFEEPLCVGYRDKQSCLRNKCDWGEDGICREFETRRTEVKDLLECSKLNPENCKKATYCEEKLEEQKFKSCVFKGNEDYEKFVKGYNINNYDTGAEIKTLFDNIKDSHPNIQQKYKDFFNQKVTIDINRLDFIKDKEKIDLIKYIGTLTGKETSYTYKIQEDSDYYYERAIQYLKEVVEVYGGEKDLNSKEDLRKNSLKTIANLYGELNDEANAIQYYQTYMDEYPVDAKSEGIDKKIELLKLLEDSVAKQVILEDNGKDIKIIFYGALKHETDKTAKALIEISGTEFYGRERWYELNDYIDEEEGWRIYDIRDGYVYIKDKNGKTKSLALGSKYEIRKGISVKVNDIDMEKEAYITLSPNIRNAYTESYFSVHIPIEKRPFDLPLFGESIDEEIEETRDLLESLDKIIDNVQKLHEIWVKFCFITYGTFWSYNLLTGAIGSSDEAIAKKRVKEKWDDKYKKEVEKNPGTNYDNFIIKNKEEYEKDLARAEAFYKNPSYAVDESDKSSFDKLDNSDKFERNFYKYMCEEDSYYCNQFAEIDLSLRVRNIERKAATISVEELEKEFPHISKQDLESYKSTFQKKYLEKELKEELVDNKKSLLKKYEDAKVTDIEGIGNTIDLINPTVSKEPNKDYYSLFNFKQKENGEIVYVPENEEIKIYEDNKCSNPLIGIVSSNKKIYTKGKNGEGCVEKKITTQAIIKSQEDKIVSINLQGRNKGTIQSISVGIKPSIDQNCYVQVERKSSGEIDSKDVYCYKSSYSNRYNEVRQGDLNSELNLATSNERAAYLSKEERNLWGEYRRRLSNAENTINRLDKKIGKYKQGEKIEQYTLFNAPVKAGASCVDFMSPEQCRILFNACDPVICPASRCNLGGYWKVDNVIETGLIGSSVLCWDNSVFAGGNVVMPVCITGILAGLRNIRTILQAYVECLQTSKTEGVSVGVCDRVRSFYFCEMFWREGMAILNVKHGVLSWISDKIFGKTSGGGEYSRFEEAVSNSVGSLDYFTNNYAKGVFAAYQGRALEELGGEVCKVAIYGKAPGLGDFFDQVTKPESPPQFTAFFEEIPYQDISGEESMYQVYFHVYAGENDDITYTVYLQKSDNLGEPLANYPIQYIDYAGKRMVNQRLEKGTFADVNANFVGRSDYNQLCIITYSKTYGVNRECGFGKVSTGYSLQLLGEYFTKQDATTKISSEEQCVPETGRLTSYSYGGGSDITGDWSLRQSLVGSFSTGLASTGVVRKCSAYDPDVGSTKNEWVPVGSCGTDKEGRDLGVCWLYLTGVKELLKDSRSIEELEKGLKTAEDSVRESVSELFVDTAESKQQIKVRINELKDLIKGGIPSNTEDSKEKKDKLKNKINEIQQYFDGRITDIQYLANMNYYLGKGYKFMGDIEEKRCGIVWCKTEGGATTAVTGFEGCAGYKSIRCTDICINGYGCYKVEEIDLGGDISVPITPETQPVEVKPIEKKGIIVAPDSLAYYDGNVISRTVGFYYKNKPTIDSFLSEQDINPKGRVSKELLLAIISVESMGEDNPFFAVSPCAAAGIMQFIPQTALNYGLDVQFKGDEFNELNEEIDKSLPTIREIYPITIDYNDIVDRHNNWKSCSPACAKKKCSPCNAYSNNINYCDYYGDERFIPEKAIPAGIRYLNNLLVMESDNLREAVKSYGDGEKYAARVMANLNTIKGKL